MRERLSEFWESVKEFWGNLSRKAKILLISAVGGVLVLCLILVLILNHKTYALLYNDLSTTESARVLAILSENNIEAEVMPNGSIMVEEGNLNAARMQLATGGFPGNAFTYDVASSGLTDTQADKLRKEKYQMQDRLQATIETFDEVSQAVVNISLPERDAFALQSDVIEPTASVRVVHRDGRKLTPQQVRGVMNIVRDAVPGLTDDNISIVDEEGDMKAGMMLDADSDNAKLSLTEEVNSSARKKILSVIQPRFGQGNVEVAVSSTLDTDDKISESVQYQPFDPENPTRNPIDYSDHTRQKVDAPGGIAEGVPGANDNVQTPQYGAEEGEEANFATYSSTDTYDYLVNSTKEQITKNGLHISDMQVAVVVNATALPDGERDQLISLAAKAASVPIENVVVQNFDFYKPTEAVQDAVIPGMTPQQTILFVIIGAILLIIIATVVILILSRRRKAAEEEEAAEGELLYDEEGLPLVDLLGEGQEFEPIPIVETTEQKLKAQIKDLADSDPEIVAQLIKTWLVGTN